MIKFLGHLYRQWFLWLSQPQHKQQKQKQKVEPIVLKGSAQKRKGPTERKDNSRMEENVCKPHM